MVTRRAFLKVAALCALGPPISGFAAPSRPPRDLSLRNIHTGETIDVEFWRDGQHVPGALAELDRLLRCHYTNEVRPIDPGVLDLLCDVKDCLGARGRIDVISGFRSPAYNARLRRMGRGVAPNSLHLQGLAIDFAAPGFDPVDLYRVARSFEVGGVGRYPDFVHIDTGRVRTW